MTDSSELFRLAAERAAEDRRTIADNPQRPLQSYSEAAASCDAPTPETGTDDRTVVAELIGRSPRSRGCRPTGRRSPAAPRGTGPG